MRFENLGSNGSYAILSPGFSHFLISGANVSKTSRLRALENQVRRLQRRLEALDKVSDRYSWLRLAIVLLSLVTTGLSYNSLGLWPAGLCAALGLLAFGAAVYGHRRVEGATACHRLWMQNKTTQIARATLDWERIPVGAAFRPRPEHPFEADLDLVGPRSLHVLVDTAASFEGSQCLKNWLTARAPEQAQVQHRQQLVRELAPMHTFRDKLLLNAHRDPRRMATGDSASGSLRHTWKAGPLVEWLTRAPEGVEGRPAAPGRRSGYSTGLGTQQRWLLLFTGLAALNASLLGVFLLGILPALWQLTALLTLGLWWFRARATAAAWNEALSLQAALSRLGAVFEQLETFSYDNKPHLRDHCAPFLDAQHLPSRYLAQVTRLVAGMSLRQNPLLGLLLNLLLPWDAYFTYRLGRARLAMSERAGDWMQAWFELEALSSLATFAYLNPGYAFPEVRQEGRQDAFRAHALGHPLIPDEQKVCNDFTIPHLGWVAIITGSNMAGKSVFLKTVGANLALAYTGGPVSASVLQTLPFRLFASMEVSDSVTDGISYFYAEVKRLKALLDELEAQDPLPVLFFIDEIFRGTNNRERLIGSQAYVRALVGKHGAGLIATHDLQLASLRIPRVHAPAEASPAALVNYHFRDHVEDGRMVFDYVLHPGPSPTTNALKIMRLEGLPVDSRSLLCYNTAVDPSGTRRERCCLTGNARIDVANTCTGGYSMDIAVSSMKRCDLVKVTGQIDSATAPQLENRLLELVEGGKGNLVIDFEDVTFLSSAGLKALLHAQIRLRQKSSHGRVVAANVPANLQEIFELVGLHHIFDMYDSTAGAVGSF